MTSKKTARETIEFGMIDGVRCYIETDYVPSFSFLKNMAYETGGSPRNAVFKRCEPRVSTSTQIAGHLYELATIRPDLLPEMFIIDDPATWPEPDKTGAAKANKRHIDELKYNAHQTGKMYVTQSDVDAALAVGEFLTHEHDVIANMRKTGEYQVEINGSIFGINYRGYADHIERFETVGNPTNTTRKPIVRDIKTVGSLSSVRSMIRNMYIDVQLAMYMNAVDADAGELVFIQTQPPYDVEIVCMNRDDTAYTAAMDVAQSWLIEFETVRETGSWFSPRNYYKDTKMPVRRIYRD